MSVVSGVTLICGFIESEDDDGEDLLKKLNALLPERDYSYSFAEVSDYYGGNKNPQHFIFGAGINHLAESAFI